LPAHRQVRIFLNYNIFKDGCQTLRLKTGLYFLIIFAKIIRENTAKTGSLFCLKYDKNSKKQSS
jgi:hypothetical protein